MKTAITLGLAGALALSGAAPALAQYASPSYDGRYAPTEQYRQDLDRYQRDRADYRAQRLDYQAARRTYDRQRDDYERARASYDARYGYGAYARVYGPAPIWDEARWASAYPADRYAADAAYVDSNCRDNRRSNTVAGGLIGALAGAALGSNVAARNARTEGTVLGALVGGAAGAAVGRTTARCDTSGYYYSYNETIPYREAVYDRRSRNDYRRYSRMGCRLAEAPIDWGDRVEYRYVRVCPDAEGRYRVAS